jgi:hypothetical protein
MSIFKKIAIFNVFSNTYPIQVRFFPLGAHLRNREFRHPRRPIPIYNGSVSGNTEKRETSRLHRLPGPGRRLPKKEKPPADSPPVRDGNENAGLAPRRRQRRFCRRRKPGVGAGNFPPVNG